MPETRPPWPTDVNEPHPDFDDVWYCERFCMCGGILKIRAHKADLWKLDDTGIIDNWEKKHTGAPHEPTDEKTARTNLALVRANLGLKGA